MDRDPLTIPSNLPVPEDDGAASHLTGMAIPPVELRSTAGGTVRLDRIESPRATVYAYPRTGPPGDPGLVDDWDSIPGARGCTPESCGFRDHRAEMEELGAAVFGLSTQETGYQAEAAERLQLGFPLLSDAELALTEALNLPVMEVAGITLLKRLTMSIFKGVIERVWYPVFPPDSHAAEVTRWLRDEAE